MSLTVYSAEYSRQTSILLQGVSNHSRLSGVNRQGQKQLLGRVSDFSQIKMSY